MRHLLCTALLLAASQATACELNFEGAWVRTAPPDATVMAGYGTLSNPGTVDGALVSVISQDFGRAELHTMSMDGDVMRMRKIEKIEVKAGESVELKPGGMHLMLFEPKRDLPEGSDIPLTLTLACDSKVGASARVMAQAPGEAASGDKPDDKAHDHHQHH